MFAPYRTWFGGVTRHPVKMGELAGREEPLTAASVRLAGRGCIVMSQVSPARWQLNREVRRELLVFVYIHVFVHSYTECESVLW